MLMNDTPQSSQPSRFRAGTDMYVPAHKYMDIRPLCMIQFQRPSQIIHQVSDESSFPTTGRSAIQSRGEIAIALGIQTRRLIRFLYVGRHPIHPPLAFHWTNCQSSFHIISELALSSLIYTFPSVALKSETKENYDSNKPPSLAIQPILFKIVDLRAGRYIRCYR